MSNLPSFLLQFFDDSGKPLSGGKLYTYVAGSTSIPKPTYTDYQKTIVASNPIILDATGRPAPIYMIDGAGYNFVLKSSTDILIDSWDYQFSYGGFTDDHKTQVDINDTTPGFLGDKLVPGQDISFTLVNPAGNEKLSLDTKGYVAVNSNDTSKNYLTNKLLSSTTINMTSQDIGAGNNVMYPSVNIDAVQTYKVKSNTGDATPGFLSDKLVSSPTINVDATGSTVHFDVNPASLTGDHKVLSDVTDTVAGYLSDKLIDSATIDVVLDNATKKLHLDVIQAQVPGDHKSMVSVTDSTPNYLQTKLLSGHAITVTKGTSGSSEYLSFAVDETQLSASMVPKGNAGGDLGGQYPNPQVKQLSGTNYDYRVFPAVDQFNIPITTTNIKASMAIKNGRGLSMMIDSGGYISFSKDGGMTWNMNIYKLTSTGYWDIEYGQISPGVYGWVTFMDSGYIFYFVDTGANYDSNGLPLQSAWVNFFYTASNTIADISYNPTLNRWYFADSQYGLFYTTTIASGMTTTACWVSTNQNGGTTNELSTGRQCRFDQISGRLWYSVTGNATSADWIEVTSGGQPLFKALVPSFGSGGKGLGSAISTSYQGGVTLFVGDFVFGTTDISDPTKYYLISNAGTLPTFWNIASDGTDFFATTYTNTNPEFYQFYAPVVVAKRDFVTDYRNIALGETYLTKYPGAQVLATDAWGRIYGTTMIQPGDLGTKGQSSTMQIAAADQTISPSFLGTYSELIVRFSPYVDQNIKASATNFNTYLIQGSTNGNLRFTLRDSSGYLIGYSQQITNPSNNSFLSSTFQLLQSPGSSPITATNYKLFCSGYYYLGILYNTNDFNFPGTLIQQNYNIQPWVAAKFDNLASITPVNQLTAGMGSESKVRFFAEIIG